MKRTRRHLLVDSHNVLHAWGWLGAPRVIRREEMAVARSRLLADLQLLRDIEGIELTVVFDGAGQSSQPDAGMKAEGFSVIDASAGLTADGLIERLVAADPDPGRSVVVTGDGTVRGIVVTSGGECLSPDDLRAWIERCRQRVERAASVRRGAHKKSFGNRLPL